MTTKYAAEMIPGDGQLMVDIVTSLGTMTVRLHEKLVPETVANFVGLATGMKPYTDPRTKRPGEGPYYDGTVFHRVISDFMIQGGDPTATGTGGPGYKFADEFHPELKHTQKGVLSMANAGPNTNGGQFFITEVATPWLDGKHAVFGQVINGLEVIDAIVAVPRGPGDRPRIDIELQKMRVYRAQD